MSRISELTALIDELIDAGQKLAEVGKGLKDYYSIATEEEPEPASDSKPTLTFADVRKVLAEKSSADDGKYKSQVKELVSKYSSNGALKGVPEDKYEALLSEVEVIGNG